ncbi:hypothetical protein ALC53_07203 [Atta colombica]|uniref:Uncharacterized protein n=1 Tax=Atta colombica TaxID=520822 RepID=A0A195BE18_9HYME|nr:hypothetical protein ALC53_07203 [Atta colombica]
MRNSEHSFDVNMMHTNESSVKPESIKNFLSYFHTVNPGLSSCFAHDMFEGIIQYVRKIMLILLGFKISVQYFKQVIKHSSCFKNILLSLGKKQLLNAFNLSQENIFSGNFTINDIGNKYNVNNYCPLINEIIKSSISSNKEICISKEICTNHIVDEMRHIKTKISERYSMFKDIDSDNEICSNWNLIEPNNENLDQENLKYSSNAVNDIDKNFHQYLENSGISMAINNNFGIQNKLYHSKDNIEPRFAILQIFSKYFKKDNRKIYF